MPNLKPIEILLIVLVVVLLFGAKRLPDLARSVGKSLKILKNEVKDLDDSGRPAGASESTPPAVASSSTAPQTTDAVALRLPLPADGYDRTHI